MGTQRSGSRNERLRLLVEHDHARGLLQLSEVLFGLNQALFGFSQLLLEEHPTLLGLAHSQTTQQFSQGFEMSIGELGRKLGFFVVHLDRDHAAFFIRRHSHVTGDGFAQAREAFDPIAILQLELVIQHFDHAVALEQSHIKLVRRFGARTASQPAELAQGRQRRR